MTLPLKKIKTSIEKLGKDSLSVAADAQKIVADGVQRLAEQELKALNDTYDSVLKSIKSSKSGESLKESALKHLDLMQDTVTKLIGSAKASLDIVAETRSELTALVGKGMKTGKVAEAELAKVTAQAKKVVQDVKSAAADAQKQATEAAAQLMVSAEKAASKAMASAEKVAQDAKGSASKVVASAQADAKKVANVVKTDVKAVRNRVGSVLNVKPQADPSKKTGIVAKPSPTSRAELATSKAKQAATEAVKTVKSTGEAVAKAVKKAG